MNTQYTVQLITSNLLYMNALDVIFIKLVGEDGESGWVWISGARCLFSRGVSTFTVHCPKSIGTLLMVEINKKKLPLLPQMPCFVEKVEVTTRENRVYKFPVYHWFKDSEIYIFREGKGVRVFEDQLPLCKKVREMELEERRKTYCWKVYKEGFPHCMDADDASSMPCEVQFSFTKDIEFKFSAALGLIEMNLKGLAHCKESWKDFQALSKVVHCHKTDVSDYVEKHWKENSFFGYQFLNGVNPTLIQRCTALPENFPVTNEMLSFKNGTTLANEMQKGNIFLCDYKLLDEVKTSTIDGKQQYLMAPLVLLHKIPDDELKPVAIQLKQTPGEDNPIFLPSDSEYDWLLAKTFVRSADFNEHELSVHLLRTHLLAEVFAVSLLRNVPMVHPLYKLLVPHTRYTLQINLLARQRLISEDGFFTKYTASGGEGMITILQRSLSSLTYSSLCIPEDIKQRGVASVPNYYYRDYGLRLWDIIHSFVKGVITHYYKSDDEIRKDTELQNYIKDIYEHGFLSNKKTGIPQSFNTVHELVKFATMVIFTCSAQHSAVNNGQFDFGGWMPNSPSSLRLPPPTEKDVATEETLLETLPDISTTVNALTAIRLLSTQSTDFVALGQYPEEYFTEAAPKNLIKKFCEELKKLNEDIDKRNETLPLPYTYLSPQKMENSVSL